MPGLFHRRECWVPTYTGWLVLLALVALTAFLAAWNLHGFLAMNRPAEGARWLVVEGWLSDAELDQAVETWRAGRYERVVTTGGPIEKRADEARGDNYAIEAADYLRRHGVAEVRAAPAPASAQDRTFLSAVMLRKWAAAQGLSPSAFDVYSVGVHARRTRAMYSLAFGDGVDVGILAASPSSYDAAHWWRTSAGAKAVLGEAIGLLWATCCFHPAPPGSHEELWAVPRKQTATP